MEESTPPAAANLVAVPSRRLRVILSIMLVAAAALYQGYNLSLALDPDDSNHLETPLALAVARQVTQGPESLYGPFTGENPLVLIHAPLYYRLSAVLAWPMVARGINPAIAALISGRLISFVGMIATLWAAAWIAGFDRMSWFARLSTIALIASAVVFGSFPATVRPDTLAISFQTLGFGFALSCFRGETPSKWRSPFLAMFFFALAFCCKQHLVVSGGLMTLLLLFGAISGRVSRPAFIAACLINLSLLAGYLAFENHLTRGAFVRSAFILPGELRKIDGTSWDYVFTVFWESAKRSIGLIAITLVLVLMSTRKAIGTRTDAILWLALVLETAAMVPLCLGSSGAWVNYAMPTVVYASILAARWLDRVTSSTPVGKPRSIALVLASLLLVFTDFRLVRISYETRSDDRQVLAMVLDDPAVRASSRDARYFVALPQFNRMYGNPRLALDQWLYNHFERVKDAEPRDIWLREALRTTVELVIVPANSPPESVPGVSTDLPTLGYRQIRQIGQYALWSRLQE